MSEWSQHIDQVAAQVVRIETQGMWGTGFVHYATDGGVRCIASARHVLEQPHRQGQRFRVWHGNRVSEFGGRGSKDALLVRLNDDYLDTAVVAVITHQLPKPVVPLISATERGCITAGMEVGWLGFPDLEGLRDRLCFFSGRISLVDPVTRHYLIDGTNVPGCSGGPVFCPTPHGLRIIGALTAYIPHSVARSDADRGANMPGFLPGLSAAVDVSCHNILEEILAKLPKKQHSLTIKLDECPKCKAPIVELTSSANARPALICKAGCGSLVDLLDRNFVNAFPGGVVRLEEVIHQAFTQVTRSG